MATLVLSCTDSEIQRPTDRKFSLPHSHLMPSLGMNGIEFLAECCISESRVPELSDDEDFVQFSSVPVTVQQ